MTGHLVLTGGRVLTGEEDLDPGWVEVRGDRVVAVGGGPGGGSPAAERVDVRGRLVLPGLVDVHQHGGGGAGHDGGPESAARAVGFHRRAGTTTVVASLVSAPAAALEARVRALVPLVADGILAGLHLEGPWLSAARAGAHPPDVLIPPAPEDVDRLLTAGAGALRMVTLAPELPGGLAAVERLAGSGVVVAVGHTDATYAQTHEALRRGARAGTHLFNAMRPVHHREPGPVVALLESAAAVELVADGVHLHPAVLAGAARAVGPGRAVLVTDATAAAGMPDGQHLLGDRAVTVRAGVARGPGGEIAGSTGTLLDAVRTAVTVAGVPLGHAVAAATAVPAGLLGLTDVGRLRPGAAADVLVTTPGLEPAGVLFRGTWVRPLPAADPER